MSPAGTARQGTTGAARYNGPGDPARYRTRALGTVADVLTAGAIDEAAAVLHSGLDWIDALASRFRPDSELTRLNRAAGRTFPASADLVEALTLACRAAAVTDGLVTPTAGRALARLGYDRDFAAMERRQPDALPPPAPLPAWEHIDIDSASGTVRLPAGVQVDLGATAKAWAADRIATRAADRLGCGVLVALGGDVSVAGPAPEGGWPVGLADACDADLRAADQVVVVDGGGLATSGTAVRSWSRGGRVVHHLIDPSTGLPARSEWRTVSVAAATCVDANIAATAALLQGEAGPGWLLSRGLPGRFVSSDGRVTAVGGWPGPEER